MKKYYKQLNENGDIFMLLTYDFIPTNLDPNLILVEITKEEYAELFEEITEASEANLKEIANETALKAQAYDIIMGEAQ
jgi:hypothetical protein